MMLLSDADQCVRQIMQQLGRKIVVATPLGLGKPVQLLNALYQQAKNDPSLDLTIITALSLCKPSISNDLASRLFDPYVDRVFGTYQDLLYEIDRRTNSLPSNVKVIEFFLTAGVYLNNPEAQQDVICTNFTHVVRDCLAYGINLIAVMIASEENNQEHFSLSCNVDLTNDLMQAIPHALLVGQINRNLPYMYGVQAEIEATRFHFVLENEDSDRKLFSIPKQALAYQEYLIGLYVSSLIKDDGCLQIGIGTLGDAVAYGLILRHTRNELYRELLSELNGVDVKLSPFFIGLFASTEMLVDGYLELYKNGILNKRLTDQTGSYLAHAGFFIGSNAFYERLRTMSKEERSSFSMRSISEINQLYGDESTRRAQRKNARFVNICMKATLLGEFASDTLENGLTVSGVGGQYNFVAMAHELTDARSIIICRSVREKRSKLESNIVFTYGNTTIPRHLRDIVVTEYGIADLRGKTDTEVIKAMLNIADSRFQPGLLHQAKVAKKIPRDYQIPSQYCNNLPRSVRSILMDHQNRGLFRAFPFGSEFTDDEMALMKILKGISEMSWLKRAQISFKGFFAIPTPEQQLLLDRMNLTKLRSIKDRIYRALLLGAMRSFAKR